MFIIVYYYNNTGPVLNLNPLIHIREVNSGSVIASGVMNEIGDGFYNYEFTNYQYDNEYTIFCDAVTLDKQYRYKFLSSGEYGDILNNLIMLNDHIEIRTLLLKKILTNKLELIDGDTDNWILYDDDNSTELLKWDVTDKNDDIIVEEPHTNSKRSKAK